MTEVRMPRIDQAPWGPPLPETVLDDPAADPERIGGPRLSPEDALSRITDPAQRATVLRRARAERRAASHRITAEGLRAMTALRDSLENNSPVGAADLELRFADGAEETIAHLAAQGEDAEHAREITAGLRQVGRFIAKDARAYQAFETVRARRDALAGLHGAFAGAIGRFPHLHDALARAGTAAVLADEADFAPADREAMAKDFAARAAVAAVTGTAAFDPDLAERDLDGGAFDNALDPMQKEALRERIAASRADRDALLARNRQEAARAAERTGLAFVSGWRAKIEAGEAGLAELIDAETAGTVTPAQAAKLRATFEAAAARRAKDDQAVARVADVIAKGGTLDPADEADRAAAEAHYRAVVLPGLDGGTDAPGFARAAVDHARATGIAPESALRPLAGLVLAGDDEEARADAARTLSELAAIDSDAADHVPPQALALAKRIEDATALGIPAERAVEMAEREADNERRTAQTRKLTESEKAVLVEALTAAGVPRDAAERQAEQPAFAEGETIPSGAPPEGGPLRKAVAPALALPFLVPEILAPIGEAILGALAMAGLLSLKSDSKKIEPGEEGDDGRDKARGTRGQIKTDSGKRTGESRLIAELPTDILPFPAEPPKLPEPELFPANPPKLPDRTEFPANPPKIPEYTDFPIPDDPGMLIDVFPDQSDELNVPIIYESRGNERTQNLNTDIGKIGEEIAEEDELSSIHTGGAQDNKGVDTKETYLPNRETGERKGSSRTDVTFTSEKTGRRLFVNAIDTKADRVTPSAREHRAAVRIVLNAKSGDILTLIRKLAEKESLDRESAKEFLRPLLHEIDKPVPDVDPRDSTAPEKLWRQWYPSN